MIGGEGSVANPVSRHDQGFNVRSTWITPAGSELWDPARIGSRRLRPGPSTHRPQGNRERHFHGLPDPPRLTISPSWCLSAASTSSWSSYLSDRIDEEILGGALEVLLDMTGVSYLSSNGTSASW